MEVTRRSIAVPPMPEGPSFRPEYCSSGERPRVRRALPAVFVKEKILSRDEALEGARMILFQNNRRLYRLPAQGRHT